MKHNIKQRRKSDNLTNSEVNLVLTSTDLASQEDISTEILLRLPIQSLLRSKCVSKYWRSLISNPIFVKLRKKTHNYPSGVFLQRLSENVNVTSSVYDFVPFDSEECIQPPFKTIKFNENVSNSSSIIILHATNGLMLCYSMHEYVCKVTKGKKYDATYYIYNPTINQVVTLPIIKSCDLAQRRPLGMSLVYDPLKSSFFKVVCVRSYLFSEGLYCIEVYDLETGIWKMCGDAFGGEAETEFMCGVHWNDAVHWVNKKGHVFYLRISEGSVDRVATPVVREQWNIKKHCYPLVESPDCLLFIDILPSGMEFDVYEMYRDYSGWLPKYHVDLNPVAEEFLERTEVPLTFWFDRPEPLFVIHCLVLGEKEENAYVVLELPGKAIRYNVVLNTYQKLCDLVLSDHRWSVGDDGFSKVGRWPGAFLFYESLYRVRQNHGT